MDLINRNLIIASNLYRASAFLSAFAYFMYKPRPDWFVAFFSVAIIILIARLIRKGFNWVRWVLLVLTTIFTSFFALALREILKENIYSGLTSLGINLLQILAVIYLFFPYKKTDLDEPIDRLSI